MFVQCVFVRKGEGLSLGAFVAGSPLGGGGGVDVVRDGGKRGAYCEFS
jgi:hypothetical protein